MANKRIVDLTEDTTPAATDVLHKQSAGGGAGSSKKVTFDNLVKVALPTVSQAEATAGVSTDRRAWTPERVAQALLALKYADAPLQVRWRDKSGAPSPWISGSFDGWIFPKNKDIVLVAMREIPLNYNPTQHPTLRVRFIVTSLGLIAQSVVLRLSATYVQVGELVNKAADQVLQTVVPIINQQNQLHEHVFTLDKTLISAGDMIGFSLERLRSDGSDTFTGAIGVLYQSIVTVRLT